MAPKFYLVNANVPEETVRLLREACEKRGVEAVEIDARSFDYEPSFRAIPGDLLYRAGITAAAGYVEQHLYQPGVATFYRHPEGPWLQKAHPLLVFQRAGVPVPRWVHITNSDRDLLRRYVERMGGFPVVIKFPGFSRGVGVTQVDSFASLFSLVDYALHNGTHPVLCAYIDSATHWRVVVVGDRVVSHYRNVTDEDDFRTSGSDDDEDYRAPAPPGLEEVAVEAVHALGDEFGGVDILEHPTGRLYVLESNNPCYFAMGQLMIGTDVSGAMIDHLLEKSKQQSQPSGPADLALAPGPDCRSPRCRSSFPPARQGRHRFHKRLSSGSLIKNIASN
jgi:hypothetical protein